MSEFEALIRDLDALHDKRATVARPMLKSLNDRRIKSIVENPTAARKTAPRKAAPVSPEGADQALRARVAHATSLLKAAVAGGSLTALEASTYEARIHHLAEGLTVTEARLRAAEEAR